MKQTSLIVFISLCYFSFIGCKNTSSFIFSSGQDKAIITKNEETKFATAYKLHPILDASGKAVHGFMLDSTDYKSLLAKNAKSIFLELGTVDSSGTSSDRKYHLTIMVVPVDSKYQKIDIVPGYSAFDFVCPCPSNAPCCPK